MLPTIPPSWRPNLEEETQKPYFKKLQDFLERERKTFKIIVNNRDRIVEAAHPSPLSARKGFFGKKSFSAIDAALKAAKKPQIDWQIPDV